MLSPLVDQNVQVSSRRRVSAGGYCGGLPGAPGIVECVPGRFWVALIMFKQVFAGVGREPKISDRFWSRDLPEIRLFSSEIRPNPYQSLSKLQWEMDQIKELV